MGFEGSEKIIINNGAGGRCNNNRPVPGNCLENVLGF
jgi:hypothetical protein